MAVGLLALLSTLAAALLPIPVLLSVVRAALLPVSLTVALPALLGLLRCLDREWDAA